MTFKEAIEIIKNAQRGLKLSEMPSDWEAAQELDRVVEFLNKEVKYK
jgi:hypothetical protein